MVLSAAHCIDQVGLDAVQRDGDGLGCARCAIGGGRLRLARRHATSGATAGSMAAPSVAPRRRLPPTSSVAVPSADRVEADELVLLSLQTLEPGSCADRRVVVATLGRCQRSGGVGDDAVLAEADRQHDRRLHPVEHERRVDTGAPLVGVRVVELVRADVVAPVGEQLLGLGQRLVLGRNTDGWLRRLRTPTAMSRSYGVRAGRPQPVASGPVRSVEATASTTSAADAATRPSTANPAPHATDGGDGGRCGAEPPAQHSVGADCQDGAAVVLGTDGPTAALIHGQCTHFALGAERCGELRRHGRDQAV